MQVFEQVNQIAIRAWKSLPTSGVDMGERVCLCVSTGPDGTSLGAGEIGETLQE